MIVRRTWVPLFLLLVLACGSNDATPAVATDAGALDGAASDGATSDAPVVGPDAGLPPIGPLCDLTKPFASIKPVTLAAPNGGGGVTLSYDELEMYFTGFTVAGHDILVTTRSAKDQPFGPATPVPNASSVADETDPSLSADGLTLYFTLDHNHIVVSTRASRSGSFGPATEVASVKSSLEADPHLTIDGSELWFRSSRGGNVDLYRAPVNAGTVGAPVRVDELDGLGADIYPALSADRLVVYFSSDRVNPNKTFTNVYVARRATASAAFDAPVAAAEFAGKFNDYPGYVSPDGCRLYFTSNTRNVDDSQQIFVAERAP